MYGTAGDVVQYGWEGVERGVTVCGTSSSPSAVRLRFLLFSIVWNLSGGRYDYGGQCAVMAVSLRATRAVRAGE